MLEAHKQQITKEQTLLEQPALKGIHLHALLLKLRARAVGAVHPGAGQLAHAALLRWFGDVDPRLSEQLHEPNQQRPFTCSCLWTSQTTSGTVSQWSNTCLPLIPNQIYWLRITLLSEVLFRLFMTRYLQGTISDEAPETSEMLSLPLFQLGQVSFDVVEVVVGAPLGMAPNPNTSLLHWSGHTTYIKLLEEARAIDSNKGSAYKLELEFASPTAFSASSGNKKCRSYLLPDPDHVFGNLARRWNAWAPDHLAIDCRMLRAYCQEWITVSDYRLRTETIHLDHAIQKGFLGQCRYLLEEPKSGVVWQNETNAIGTQLTFLQTLHLLSRFAFYSGIGTKTTMGMGQTQLLLPLDD